MFSAAYYRLDPMEPKLLQPLTFGDILRVWCGFSNYYGLEALSKRCSFEIENLRETLMKSSAIWADNWFNLEMVNELIQVLTIMQSISFKVSMDGESVLYSQDLEESTWVDANQIYPVPKMRPPLPIREKIFNFVRDPALKTLYVKEVGMAIEECESAFNLASSSSQVQARFKAIQCHLQDVLTVAKA